MRLRALKEEGSEKHKKGYRPGGGRRQAGETDAIDISKLTVRKIRQNLFLAFAYNVAALPLAMLGVLTPVIAGAAMAISSVSVVTNALTLKRWQSSAI